MASGLIFDIQRFSTHDGPGIRTVVFLKGCALRCQWCANPESQSDKPQILFAPERCVGCHACLDVRLGGAMRLKDGNVRPDRSKPVPEGLAEACPSQAIRVAGRRVTVGALVNEVLRDRAYFERSGGGVTFSGGEPLEQEEFVREAVERFVAAGVSCAVETCLAVESSVVERLIALPLLWLVDVKHVDGDKLHRYTGGDADALSANIRTVARSAEQVRYRLPLIPGFNDSSDERDRILAFLASLERADKGPLALDVLPCHDLGAGKYRQLGRTDPFTALGRPADSTIDAWTQACRDRGYPVTTGG